MNSLFSRMAMVSVAACLALPRGAAAKDKPYFETESYRLRIERVERNDRIVIVSLDAEAVGKDDVLLTAGAVVPELGPPGGFRLVDETGRRWDQAAPDTARLACMDVASRCHGVKLGKHKLKTQLVFRLAGTLPAPATVATFSLRGQEQSPRPGREIRIDGLAAEKK
jgi:hypothetical protein